MYIVQYRKLDSAEGLNQASGLKVGADCKSLNHNVHPAPFAKFLKTEVHPRTPLVCCINDAMIDPLPLPPIVPSLTWHHHHYICGNNVRIILMFLSVSH